MKLTIHEKENALKDALIAVEGLGEGYYGSEWEKQVSRCSFNGRRDELRSWVVERFLPAKELVDEENKFETDDSVRL